MAGATDYLTDALLNNVLRATNYAPPAAVYVALFTAAPSDAYTSGAPDGTEVSGGSYARTAVTFGAPAAGSPGKQCQNSAAVTFPTATASWGTVTHFGIFNASSGGELFYWAAVDTSKAVNNGDTAEFATNAITIKED